MTHYKQFFTLIFLLFPFLSFSQTTENDDVVVKGIIIEQGSSTPLPYANIGVLGKPVGTISDINGSYSLKINKIYLTDTIQASLVGYSTQKIVVRDFIKNNSGQIKLNQKSVLLSEVIVSSKQRLNFEVVGTKKKLNIPQVHVGNGTKDNDLSGFEAGMRYNTDKTGALLKDFNCYIARNDYEKIKLRVNVYSIKNDLPDTLLCNKPIYITLDRGQKGDFKVDLEPYNIIINGDFVVSLQWVECKLPLQDNSKFPIFAFPISLSKKGKKVYAKKASQDKWEEANVNLTHYVTLNY